MSPAVRVRVVVASVFTVASVVALIASPSQDQSSAGQRASCFGIQFETRRGTGASDVLFGTSGNDTMRGRGGDDGMFGLDGNDRLCGGHDDDSLVGGDGVDRLNGGPGTDTCVGEIKKRCER